MYMTCSIMKKEISSAFEYFITEPKDIRSPYMST